MEEYTISRYLTKITKACQVCGADKEITISRANFAVTCDDCKMKRVRNRYRKTKKNARTYKKQEKLNREDIIKKNKLYQKRLAEKLAQANE